jgi:hypothetical protein
MNMAQIRHTALAGFLALLAVFYPLSTAFAQDGRYSDWHMGPGMMGSWGMDWFGGIFMKKDLSS